METLDSLQLNADIPGVILLDTEPPQTIIPDSTLFSTPGSFSVPLELDPVAIASDTNNRLLEELPQEIIPDTATDLLIGEAIANAEAVASFQNTGTGLTAQYFDTLNLINPIFTRTDATVDFDWGLGSPHSAIEADSFSVRWTGKVQPLYTESYTFHTLSNDGVRLWVNGELLIDQWVRQDTTEHRGTISLEAGQFYDIQLDYYERNGNAVSKLSWSSDSQPKEIVPTSQLYPIHQFPQPVPGDSEGLELELIADSFYNPGETVSIVGRVSGEDVNANLNRLDFFLQKDGGEWIEITNAIAFTVNPDDSDSIFFNSQLRDLEPGHYQLSGVTVDGNGNSGEIISQGFTILSLEAGDVEEQAELSDRVLQAIASATNLDNYSPEQLAATREWVVSVKNSASSQQLANDFQAENLGETGYIPNTYFWEFPAEMNPRDIVASLGEEVNIEFAYPLVPLDIEFFSPTNEPNFDAQWYLQDADIPQVWENYQGEGVVVGIVDDGFDINHSDLASNYRPDLSWDFDQNNSDPSQTLPLILRDPESDSQFIYQTIDGNTDLQTSRNLYRLGVEHIPGTLTNVTLNLGLNLVDINELDISLVSPEGTQVELSEFTEVGEGNFSISTDVFNGENPSKHPVQKNYNWTLEIENHDQKNGILRNWSLALETSNPHGTAVAGIVAARGDNGLLGTGVAPLANWAGLQLGADGFREDEIADALSHQNQEIDIYNNSWGRGFLSKPLPMAEFAFERGVKAGRGGLGSIYVFSGGNDGHRYDNVNYNSFANSRHTIAVAAIDNTNQQSFYSNPGAPVLVSAYANDIHSFFKSPQGEENFNPWEAGYQELFLREIRDGQTFSDPLLVSDVNGPINDVVVNLEITHENYEDLKVVLVSPSGTEVELFANVSFTERDYLDQTFFELEGVTPLVSFSTSGQKQLPAEDNMSALFLGTFQPSGDLTDLIGEDANGTWKLKVTDKSGHGNDDDNQLKRWSLNISTSGIVTTDIEGPMGYTEGADTQSFGGTSAAAPLVSGVIALMLEANPNLSSRDVQHILVETADRNDPSDEDWTINGAGHEVNHKYGFGVINAQKAVEMTEQWYNLGKTLAEEESIASGEIPVINFIPEFDEEEDNFLTSTIEFEDNLTVEWAQVRFKGFHYHRGDLEVVLVHSYEDPETGEMKTTESLLAEPRVDYERNYDWWFTTARHWGEPSRGEWTLRVRDTAEQDTGIFDFWELELFGTKPQVEIVATDADASESGDAGEFAITLNESSAEDLRVYYAIEGTAVNGVDYVEGNTNGPLSDSVVIPAGTTEVMIPIEAVDDDEVEENETAILRLLEDVGYGIGDEGIATVNIADNDTAPIIVTNTNNSGEGSLRDAIIWANDNPGRDTILFDIPGDGPHTISPTSGLPEITEAVLIDGWSQNGDTPPDTPLIELSGSNAGDSNGLTITGSQVEIRGLAINNWRSTVSTRRSGILIGENATDNWIYGSFIGTNVDGTSAASNGDGIEINGDNNIIGTNGDGIADAAEGNLISGNVSEGLEIFGDSNIVAGNLIGTNLEGTAAIANGGSASGVTGSPGVAILDLTGVPGVIIFGENNIIGTNGDGIADAAESNLISGNRRGGVYVNDNSNVVAGNLIGTNLEGTAAIPNGSYGVLISGHNNIIGTNGDGIADAAESNLISGNARGVEFIQTYEIVNSNGVFVNSQNNRVAGNRIGTNLEGTESIANGHGVVIEEGDNNIIGTNGDGIADAAEVNLISGNDESGVIIRSRSDFNIVAGNLIGTNLEGTAALSNGEAGVFILEFANNNIIGTNGDGIADTAEGNLISGNLVAGVMIWGNSNIVAGNYIGTDLEGTSAISNYKSVLVGFNSSNNRIGGTNSGEGNIIAFNYSDGIQVGNGSNSNRIQGNSIFSNAGIGINLNGNGVTANDIGDSDTGANNLQNFPELTSVTSDESTTTIQGTLNSTANTTFTLEFFSNSTLDYFGHGEGETFLGSQDVTTDSEGNASFTANISRPLQAGYFITATATDPNGNTSEFSQGITEEPEAVSRTNFNFSQKFLASDGASSDVFGKSVSLNGNFALIGATGNDDNGSSSGSAYLFDITSGNQLQKFITPDDTSNDQFGWSVALHEDYALIGSYSHNGSAYLFDITSGDLLQKFIAPDSANYFGSSVALHGDYALIGSWADDDNGRYSGSAYLFDLTSGSLLQKFIAPDGVSGGAFGYSVALEGNYALIGSWGDDDNGDSSGSAYLFDLTSGNLLQKFIAPDGASHSYNSSYSYFGWSVTLHGDYVLIGSRSDNHNGSDSGSAYLFDLTSGDLLQKFIAPDGASEDSFGWSVALEGDYALIGSYRDDDNGNESGSAYLFDLTSRDLLQKFTAPDGTSSDFFGYSVTLDGNSVLIGSEGDDDSGSGSGSAYLFAIE